MSFNHHESYIRSLADTGFKFDIVKTYKNLDLSWNEASGPVPANIDLVEFDQDLRQRLRQGHYDLVICHTIKNLLWMFPYRKPHFIFIAHIPLYFGSMGDRIKSFFKK